MRRIFQLLGLVAAMLLATNAHAQDKKLFNHLAIGAEVGTTGWGFEAAMPLTHYVTFRTGFTTLPRFNVNFDIDYTTKGVEKNVDVKGRVHMSDYKLLADIYPFKHSSFHVTGGFYAGLPDLGTVRNVEPLEVDEGEGLEIGDVFVRPDEYNTAHIVTPKFNSLNKYKQPLHRCKHCGYSTITSTEDVKNCPVCGQEMEKVKICSPLGFCVDYSVEPEDFNGSFDWYSPNSDIKLDCEESLAPCPKVHNLIMRNNLIPSSGLVHLVNDNNGDYYRMGLNSEGIYISRDAYPEEIANNLKLEFESKYAFVSSKTTGVLTLGIDKVPNNICLIPINEFNDNSFAVRAAFLSWGFLARKAVSSYLDIDSSELTVGYYISPKTQKAEIFFVERLENGAGYCNFLWG